MAFTRAFNAAIQVVNQRAEKVREEYDRLPDRSGALRRLTLTAGRLRNRRARFDVPLHVPWLNSLRSDHRFTERVNRAAALDLEARTVFLDNGGGRRSSQPGMLTPTTWCY